MNIKNILNEFPVPDFLNLPYAGISISDSNVCCVIFKKEKNVVTLDKYAVKPIPQGTVISGVIENQKNLVDILVDIKKELGILYAKVSLPEEKGYIFTTTIPVVSKEELRSAIEFKIEENVPLSVSEVFFDYMVVNHDDYTDKLKIAVSVIPSKIVDSYVEVFAKAEISLLCLETESQAIARATVGSLDEDTNLIVHFVDNRISFYLVSGGIVHFTSSLPREIDTSSLIKLLSNEIKKIDIYWNSISENQSGDGSQINKIIVCGEKIDEDITNDVASAHKIPVEVADVWRNVLNKEENIPGIHYQDSLKYASAIGLAMPSEILIQNV